MAVSDIRKVVDVWAAQTDELGQWHRSVQVFENKVLAMGCSNPHPHGQIWEGNFVPNEIAIKVHEQRRGDLGDIHQRQTRRQPDSHAAEHPPRINAPTRQPISEQLFAQPICASLVSSK